MSKMTRRRWPNRPAATITIKIFFMRWVVTLDLNPSNYLYFLPVTAARARF